MVILLAVYLILLYRADYAKDVSMDTIAPSMEKYDAITQLGQEDRVQTVISFTKQPHLWL